MNLFLDKVKAGYPLLWVNTYEEFRAMTLFAKELEPNNYNLFVWDRCDGITKKKITNGILASSGNIGDNLVEPLDVLNWATYSKETDCMPEESVLFLKDFHHYVKKDVVCRKLRNLVPILKSKSQVLVILTPSMEIPTEIEKEISVIHFKLPTFEELKIVLRGLVESTNTIERPIKYPDKDEEEAIINAALGMTAFEAENAFAVSLVEAKKFDPAVIQREKASIVKKTNLIEVVETNLDIKDIGGLNNLKAWLSARRNCFSSDARNYGLTPPRGLLLVGLPGTGKSLTAKCTAKILGRPLLRLDVANLYGGLVGQSEENLRRCINICEAVAPCVLFIDEMEKAFAGATGSSGDSGVAKRIFGTFLTWLSDKTSDVFLVATANNVSDLPSAILRSGRFDAIFWVDLPDSIQREEILNIHIAKKGRDPKKFNMFELLKVSERFTGAEIENWVKEAMVYSYSRKEEFNTSHLIATVKDISLIADLMSDQIQIDQAWAEARGVKKAYIKPENIKIDEIPAKRRIKI